MLFLFFFHTSQVGQVGFEECGKFKTFFLKPSLRCSNYKMTLINDKLSKNMNKEKLFLCLFIMWFFWIYLKIATLQPKFSGLFYKGFSIVVVFIAIKGFDTDATSQELKITLILWFFASLILPILSTSCLGGFSCNIPTW